MTLSRKHYAALAATLRPHVECGNLSQEVLDDLQGYLKSDNPRFDYHRFEKACGVKS